MKDGQVIGLINPEPGLFGLEEAIMEAVRLRSDEGVTAFPVVSTPHLLRPLHAGHA